MTDLRCMSYTLKGMTEILVAGYQHYMLVIDIEKGIISKKVPRQILTDEERITKESIDSNRMPL